MHNNNNNYYYYLAFNANDRIYTSEQKRSSDIREKLDIFNINDKLMQYKINCMEHIRRMDENKL